jgi:hypothetical protein
MAMAYLREAVYRLGVAREAGQANAVQRSTESQLLRALAL